MAKQSAQETWERSPGFVYFIAAGDSDPPVAVKIGISTEATLNGRFRRIQGSNHEKLRRLRLIPFPAMKDAEAREQELHRKFEKFQRHERGTAGQEWFDPAPDLLDFINDKNKTIPWDIITESQVQTGPASSNQYTDIEEFMDELQQNMNIDDDEIKAVKHFHDALVFPGILLRRCAVEVYVKDFHDVLVLPGYSSLLERSLQFRLSDVPDKIVMMIYATGKKKGRMEINLGDHPKKTLIEKLLKNHVNLDKLPSYNPESQYPSISWDDWKIRIDKFLSAFEQIAEESWKNQK